MDALNSPGGLEFFISEKQDFLVVALLGTINKANAPLIEKCQLEVLTHSASYVVLSLHDVTQLDTGGIPALVRFQKAIRDKPAELRICFVKPEFHKILNGAGAIRPNE